MKKRQSYKKAFINEAEELLADLNTCLIALEKEPADLAHVDRIFRAAHSLKGMAATMGYEAMAQLTHHMEGVLDSVRQGQAFVTDDLISLIFDCLDTLQALLASLAAGNGGPDAGDMIDRVKTFKPAPSAKTDSAVRAYTVTVVLSEDCVLKSVRAYMVLKRLNYLGHVHNSKPSLADIEDEKFGKEFTVEYSSSYPPERISEDLVAVGEVDKATVTPTAPWNRRATDPKSRAPIAANETRTVRVSISHLDNLVDLVGELVVARSRLQDICANMSEPLINEVIDDLHRVSDDLQYEVMQTRMVPVGNILSRFPRLARDTAKQLGKKIDFVVEGSDIELDRMVLDEIGDPLVHLIRNAIGHGIESSSERLAAGKPDTGTVTLTAAREKNTAVIGVSDDGSGIDPHRLRQVALGAGFVTKDDVESLRDEDVYQLICLPGFTTRPESDTVSGRGVGMDVVKGRIEALGGTLTIRSQKGKGTEFIM